MQKAIFILAIALAAGASYAQQQQQFGDATVEQGFADMYNLRFPEAHGAFESWGKAHPDDPRTAAFQAAADLFDQFNRLHILQSEFVTNDDNFLFPKQVQADPLLRERMLANFAKAKQMADVKLIRDPNNADALMAQVLRSGLYADYLALIAKRDTAALAEIKQGTAWADRLLKVHPDLYDAYLASGVENYLLSQKVAPVRWLLRLGGAHTDRDKGLHDLRIVADKGHYLKPYAQLLLAVAALRADDKTQACKLLASLAERYPQNPLYRKELEKIRG